MDINPIKLSILMCSLGQLLKFTVEFIRQDPVELRLTTRLNSIAYFIKRNWSGFATSGVEHPRRVRDSVEVLKALENCIRNCM